MGVDLELCVHAHGNDVDLTIEVSHVNNHSSVAKFGIYDLILCNHGSDCRGYKSDSKCVGYERMGRALATAKMYEFRPLYGGGKSPTSQCS